MKERRRVLCISTSVSVNLHLNEPTNGQTDKHKGPQSMYPRIYETAGSLEPTQNDTFSLKTEQKRTTTKTYCYTGHINSFFVIVSCHT